MTSRRRYRAPTADGEALIDPPLSEAAKLLSHNKAVGDAFDRQAGFPTGFRVGARPTPPVDGPMIYSGHQPELFHPGVWLKNFVLSAVSQAAGGTGVNLNIDVDTIRNASIRVPTGTLLAPQVAEISFDASGPEVPWEVRRILDRSVFSSFTSVVRRAYKSIAPRIARTLLLDRLWPHVLAVADDEAGQIRPLFARASANSGRPSSWASAQAMRTVNLGDSLSGGRHRLESEFGIATREISLSSASLQSEFLTFADHILSRHTEFHAIYNQALAQFRLTNGVRNRSRPLPDLSRDGEWYEMPFWIWTFDSRQRRRTYVRQTSRGWEASDREAVVFDSTFREDTFNPAVVLIEKNIVFRPRALITTMYARLVLSDLFIHGIGGAKYDEVTDEIIRRFFGIEPPKYITATATFRLPIERPHVTIEDVREAKQKLRDVRYRPENFLRDPLTKQVPGLRESLQALADEKREYVRTHDLRRCAEQVFARLDTINRAMHELLKPIEQVLRAQDAQLQEDLRRADLLGSREFSFVLFPADELPARLLALSKVSA